ncbi:response regulator transcription factor [Methyloversatilis thermotolerans]|uniref:response regulator transcription factor n=1 Tax=Methyloversatilis thermotolerans TaxID=1346290 RepID=UPI00036B6CCC|nr:response regulator [Methyloversatilis thermotolerans]
MADSILVIDDDEIFNAVLVQALRRRGHVADGCCEAERAVDVARTLQPSRIVLDLNLAGSSGLALVRPLLERLPQVRIVVLTGYASITTAVDAIKLGAIQYLAKPVEVDAILSAFESGVDARTDAPLDAEPLSVGRLEWEHIQRVLKEHEGNISATARALKMHRRTLQRKLMKRPVKA